MWFMIKTGFWFSLVLVALPFLDPGSRDTLADAPPVEVGVSVAAAIEAFEDIRQICARKPDVCETGGQTFAALGVRAKEGARIAYQFLDARFDDGKDGSGATDATKASADAGGLTITVTEAEGADDDAFAGLGNAAEDRLVTGSLTLGTIPVPTPAPAQ